MPIPLRISYTKASVKYLEALDATTKKRIKDKIGLVAIEPENVRHSFFLTNSNKRRAQVGKYRILMLVSDDDLIVSDIGSRGQIYRNV